MRIVSQNKRVDINYQERGIVLLDNSLNIDAFDSVADRFYINCTDNNYVLGIYTTEERALEVMEEIENNKVNYDISVVTLNRMNTIISIEEAEDIIVGYKKYSFVHMPKE